MADPSTHATPVLRALRHRFRVTTPDAALTSAFSHALVDLRETGSHDESPVFEHALVASGPDTWGYWRNGEAFSRSITQGYAIEQLLWGINDQTIKSETDRLTFHAGMAVGDDGRGVLLPAESGSGKTTLTAGLVRAGMAYVSDECVAVDLASLVATGYPKPLSVKDGSWQALADLEPRPPWDLRPWFPDIWQVPISAIGGRVARQGSIAWLAFPKYEAGARTRIEPVHRADALMELLHSAFNLTLVGRPGFLTAARLVAATEPVRVVFSDLDAAVELVRHRLAGPAVPVGAHS